MPLTHDIGVRIPYPLRRTIATAVVFHFLRDGAGSRTEISAQDSDKRSLRRRNDEKHVSPNATFEERRGAPPQDERPEISGRPSFWGDSIPPASERSCEKERKRHLAVDIGGQAQRSAATGPFLTVSCCRQAKAAKTKNSSEKSDELLSVPRTRLELARTKRSLPPQSSVSTNFTTWAF